MSSETGPLVSDGPTGAAKRARRGRWMVVGVFSAFLLPLLLAVYLYANLDVWRPSTRVNHGELLEPIHPLAFLGAVDAGGGQITLDRLQRKWTLLYVAEGECRLECQAALFKSRQAHAMLGRELTRVQYAYLALDEVAVESLRPHRGEHPLMLEARVPLEQKQAQLEAFGLERVAGFVYLIDPHANLVLRYGPQSTTKGLLRDLHRLLKVSRIG